MSVLLVVASLLACGWLSWFGTKKYLLIALEHRVVDIPNDRSSHSVPTPRGGGIVFAIVFLAGVACLSALHLLQPLEAVSLFAGALVAILGFWDDCAGLPIVGRLIAQVMISAAAVICLLATWWPQVWRHPLLPIILIGAVFGFVWLINLTNFMDGIDGIATTEIICVGASCSLIVLARHNFDTVALSFALLAVSTSGFLIWNWPPAAVFMGDAGSCFLGYVMGALMLTAVVRGDLAFPVPLILLGVFIIDATLTLGKRFLRGEQWYLPHCTHAFQHAAKRYGHLRTTLGVAAINILWLAPLAFLAEYLPSCGWLLLIIAWLPLLAVAQHLGAGVQQTQQRVVSVRMGSARRIAAITLVRTRFASLINSSALMNATKIFLLVGISWLALYLTLLSQFPASSVLGLALSRVGITWALTQCGVLVLFRIYRSQWRLLSLEEIPTITGMSLVAGLAGALVALALCPSSVIAYPRFILFECLFLIVLSVGLQVATPLVLNACRPRTSPRSRRRIAIFGATQAGVDILSSLRRLCPDCEPLGFIDSRPELRGAYVCGLPLLGSTSNALNTVETYGIHELLLPSAEVSSGAALSLIQLCKLSGITYTIVHSIEQDILPPALGPSRFSPSPLGMAFSITHPATEASAGSRAGA
ncbi:MAG: hypothetical protein PW789_00165 [Edaphobacter sp.]|uniref:hypothetical protein n=1 Tax=Edaphobacter sp. TaxID=1934404 RepID=UPI002390C9FD|nr:hypothetical protein [Edaphobacter sp.]MDE1175005.1 hypothetical protein [Edaphobacter sp.]